MLISVEKIKCPKCGSSNNYTRVTGVKVCRKCGNVWDIPDEAKE